MAFTTLLRRFVETAAVLGATALAASAQNPADLESQARGILEKRCLGCHGPAIKTSGLDLSARESALRGGTKGAALKPGSPEDSLLIRRVMSGQMPPNSPLPAAEREALRRWIQAGAPWQESRPGTAPEGGPGWWSLQGLKRTEAPDPAGIPERWRKTDLDRRVFAKLQEMGLRPSPPAPRQALIRRASFDLLGLPPKPEEVDAFVNDPDPGAYEKLVDRLLASPQYGERQARHWLDVVRYTESEGFERDWPRDNAWAYRDYVIKSFNDDRPYAEFAKQQIAGDVLEPVTRDGIVATGFLVSGPTDEVGLTSAVAEQRAMVREDQLEEMLGAVSQTFLGLTVNCARCHNHKFDPIPQKDYYRMKAVFEGVWQGDRPLLTPDEQAERDRRTGPLRKAIGEAEDELARIQAPARERFLRSRGYRAAAPAPFAQWTFDTDARDSTGSLHGSLTEKAGVSGGLLRPAAKKEPVTVETSSLRRDLREKTLEAWILVHKLPEKGMTVLQIANASGYRGAAMDAIRYAGGANHQWENSSTARFRSLDVKGPPEDAKENDRLHMAITYSSDGTIALYRNGQPYGKPYKPEIDTPVGRLQTYLHDDATVSFTTSPDLELDEARLYDAALSPEQVAASFAAGAPSAEWEDLRRVMTAEERRRAESLRGRLAELAQELKAIPDPAKVYAAVAKKPEPTFLLARGDVNRKTEQVTPAGLSCLQGHRGDFGLSPNADEAERRRKLAEWIASAENPLFSRVMVNRVWQSHFGAGLVASPSDFGVNGGRPSHPELLDALALKFIESGWSLKKLHREILLSETYSQSSAFNPEASAKDADNRFLWRFAPRRLEGEEVRDAILAASGRLNPKMGGPSFRPFTYETKGSLYIYAPIDKDDAELDRRTVYRMNVNSAGSPMLEALDCPVPSVKTPRRATTTTALQALSLMNSPFVMRQMKAFAERVNRDAGADAPAQIDRAFRLALGRPPAGEELAWSRPLLQEQGLEALCWGLFNSSEFVYIH